VSESAILLGLAWWYMGQPGMIEELLAYITIVGSFLVSYTRGRAEGLGVDCKVGLFTRVERTLVLIIALLLGVPEAGLWLLAVGTPLTAFHRMMYVYMQTKNLPL
jgi:CDP-diacylglycerol--glycerol-3-phosphate 3-phosphatidyltransferase